MGSARGVLNSPQTLFFVIRLSIASQPAASIKPKRTDDDFPVPSLDVGFNEPDRIFIPL